MNKQIEQNELLDIFVIGGGINGAGIARDAAGRNFKVALCEQDDLAQHTSSSSTKLIHGGLRYLEHYDFKLVRHALQEREVLLRNAPHIIWPLRFILPHHKDLRPRWLIRLGLFLYDHIGGRKLLPTSNGVDLSTHVSGECLQDSYKKAFEYSDCWVQDARLVVLNARDAKAKGANIMTRTKCVALERGEKEWKILLRNTRDDSSLQIRSRSIVNAAGPWVKHIFDLDKDTSTEHGARLVKGSHIVVRKKFDHGYPYIFQNADNRIIFAIPYENDYTLLGTTDVEIGTEPGKAKIDNEEIKYICAAANEYFADPVKPSDVVWSYTGVRPLFDDASQNASKVTRDYVLQLDDSRAPILSVFGGKITTYRKLSEEVVEMMEQPLGFKTTPWTANRPLPGGDIANADFDHFVQQCKQNYTWLDDDLLLDYTRNYGTDIHKLLLGCQSMPDLGEDFGAGLYENEVRYLIEYEWAETADDILWRRTKKGLHGPKLDGAKLADWLRAR